MSDKGCRVCGETWAGDDPTRVYAYCPRCGALAIESAGPDWAKGRIACGLIGAEDREAVRQSLLRHLGEVVRVRCDGEGLNDYRLHLCEPLHEPTPGDDEWCLFAMVCPDNVGPVLVVRLQDVASVGAGEGGRVVVTLSLNR